MSLFMKSINQLCILIYLYFRLRHVLSLAYLISNVTVRVRIYITLHLQRYLRYTFYSTFLARVCPSHSLTYNLQ